jgi:peptidoglycan hydrolase CwlO-like protein
VTFDAGTLLALILAGVSVIVWLVRLEGRVNSKATADQIGALNGQDAALNNQIAALAAVIGALQAKEASHDQTRDEVIRLQEQIKHLTNLIERLLPPARRKVTP